jgi:hypothetical protein
MRRSRAPSIIQHGDPEKKPRHATRGADAAAAAAHASASALPPLTAAAAAAQATLATLAAVKKPYKVRSQPRYRPEPCGAKRGGGF